MRQGLKIFSCLLLLCLVFPFFSTLVGCSKSDKNYALSTNKTEYLTGEEIYVTAKGDGDSWVGVYRAKDNLKTVESIRWYNVAKNGFISNQSYGLQHSATYNASRELFRNFPAGDYKAVLFKDNTNKNIAKVVNFKVKNVKIGTPSAPTKIEYTLNNSSDGLADGKLTISFDKAYTASEAILYWANDEGILTDYASLAPIKVVNNPTVVEMPKNMFIPAEATKIIAYSKNSVGLSEGYAEFVLPEGCQYKLEESLISEFQVVSDVHITVANTHLASADAKELHDKHFIDMLHDVVENSPNSDGVFVVGDIANSGRDYEYKHTQELISQVADAPDMYFSIGNHDLYGDESFETLVSNYYEFANTNSVYFERVINGYHHIFLGSESKSNGLYADMSDAQLQWFDNLMASLTAEQANKPVFVYLHQSLYDTIAGSFEGQGWNGIVQDSAFRQIVSKYSQIVMFNGHSHWDLNSIGNMHSAGDGLPSIFNTASVAYLWDSFYIPTGEYLLGSQGYYLRVYQDKVLVLGRDFANKKWLPNACYVIDF